MKTKKQNVNFLKIKPNQTDRGSVFQELLQDDCGGPECEVL